MRTIADYIDAAIAQTGKKSRYQLSLELNLPNNIFTRWEKHGQLPTDDNMLILSRAARIPDHEALADLAIWRAMKSEQPEATAIWKKIAGQLQRTGIAVLLAPAFMVGAHFASPADAGQLSQAKSTSVYYGKYGMGREGGFVRFRVAPTPLTKMNAATLPGPHHASSTIPS